MQSFAPWAVALAAGALFLGRFELHTDDTGVEVALVLLLTFILGCWQPKWAWLAALLGLSVPITELIWGTPNLKSLGMVTAVAVILGVIGSFTGVLARKIAMRARQTT